MSEPWNNWYPHEIDIWQGSGAIQILSDTAYRAVHNIIMEMWKSADCALEEKELHQASRVLDRYAGVRDEVLAYMDRTEDGRITHFVQRGKWQRAKDIYEANQAEWDGTSEARSAAGKAGAKARWQKRGKPMAKPCDADGKPMANDALTVTSTLTKNKVPSRPEGDPRHVPFKLACEVYAKHMRVEFAWDGSEAKQLALLLKACPALTLPQFQGCLNHRARSPGTPHGERPRVWLPNILKYQEAPLNTFGKTGDGNGIRSNSKSERTLEALRGSLEAGPDQTPPGSVSGEEAGGDWEGRLRGVLEGSIEPRT